MVTNTQHLPSDLDDLQRHQLVGFIKRAFEEYRDVILRDYHALVRDYINFEGEDFHGREADRFIPSGYGFYRLLAGDCTAHSDEQLGLILAAMSDRDVFADNGQMRGSEVLIDYHRCGDDDYIHFSPEFYRACETDLVLQLHLLKMQSTGGMFSFCRDILFASKLKAKVHGLVRFKPGRIGREKRSCKKLTKLISDQRKAGLLRGPEPERPTKNSFCFVLEGIDFEDGEGYYSALGPVSADEPRVQLFEEKLMKYCKRAGISQYESICSVDSVV